MSISALNPMGFNPYDPFYTSYETDTDTISAEDISDSVSQLSPEETQSLDLFSQVNLVKSNIAHIISQGDNELIQKYLAIVMTMGKLMFLSQQADSQKALEIHQEIQTMQKKVRTLYEESQEREGTIKLLDAISTVSTVVTTAASVGALIALCVASGGTVAAASGIVSAIFGLSSGTTSLTEALLTQKNEQITGERVEHQTKEEFSRAELGFIQDRVAATSRNSTRGQEDLIKSMEKYRTAGRI